MLIGLHGKKQAGKDTVYERILAKFGPGTEADCTVERVSFADKLYESAAAALGVTVDDLRMVKSNPKVGVALVHLVEEFHELAPEGIAPFGEPLTVREYLQRYGTEAHRDVFGTDFWVAQADLSHDRKIVVVTDVRFRNEAQAVIDAGGTVVRVMGPPSVENADDGHASEKPLPSSIVDQVLINAARDDNFGALDSAVTAMVARLIRDGLPCRV